MDGPPLDILRRCLAVDGGAEYIEHPRHDLMAYRYLERPARIFNLHSSGEALSRRESNAPNPASVELGHDFDDDLAFCTSM
jgi:hypothetical protein